MASEISMNGRKKIETIQREFTSKFPYLTLVFLDRDRKALDVTKSLSDVRQAKGDDISIVASLKVNTLEKRFLQNFGLIVEVAYKKSERIVHTKESIDKTLNELNKWCEVNECQPFNFKSKNSGNTLQSLQEQLFEAISNIYPNAIAKKINKDNFLDIHIPEINPQKGTHLFFNTAKEGIKIGFYCRDEAYKNKVLSSSENVEKYAQGIRIVDNPIFEAVSDAIISSLSFLQEIEKSVEEISENTKRNKVDKESSLKQSVVDENKKNLLTVEVENNLEIQEQNILLIKELQKFDPESMADIIVASQDGIVEIGNGIGNWEGNKFTFEYRTEWDGGFLEGAEVASVNDIISLLNSKNVLNISQGDFGSLGIGELTNGNTIYYNFQWDKSVKINKVKDAPPEEQLCEEADKMDCEYFWESPTRIEFTISGDQTFELLGNFESLTDASEEITYTDVEFYEDIDQLLHELKGNSTNEKVLVRLYTDQSSELIYWLKYEINLSEVEITRTNWSDDSYWEAHIDKADLIEGLKGYLANSDLDEFIENYLSKDLIDYKFSSVGGLDNGLQYEITSISPELSEVPEDLQDYAGNLDITELTNSKIAITEELSEQNIGSASFYEIIFNEKVFKISASEKLELNESIADGEANNLSISHFVKILRSAEDPSEQVLIYYSTNTFSTFSTLLKYKVKGEEITLKRNHWYEKSFWSEYVAIEELLTRLDDAIDSEDELTSYLFKSQEFYMVGEGDNGFDIEYFDSSLSKKKFPKAYVDDDGEIDVWKLYENAECFECDESLYDDDIGSASQIFLEYGEYKCLLNPSESIILSDDSEEEQIESSVQLYFPKDRVLTAVFDSVSECNEGVLKVEKNGQYGFLNLLGSAVVNCEYNYVSDFSDGYCFLASTNENQETVFDLIDKSFSILYSLKNYYNAKPPNSFGAWVQKVEGGNWLFLNHNGKVILNVDFDEVSNFNDELAWCLKNSKIYVLSLSGESKLIGDSEEAILNDLGNGVFAISNSSSFIFFKRNGEKLNDLVFDNYEILNEIYIGVCIQSKWGVMASNGQLRVPCIYDAISYANSDLFVVTLDEKMGVIDVKNNKVSDIKYDQIESFEENYAIVTIGDFYGIIDKSGVEVYPCSINDLPAIDYERNTFIEFTDSGARLVDIISGMDLLENKYQSISRDGNDLLVSIDDKWGWINVSEEVLIGLKYDDAFPFYSSNLARVKLNDKIGFINRAGDIVIEPVFQEAEQFNDNLAIVSFDGDNYGVIDDKGKIILEPIYSSIEFKEKENIYILCTNLRSS